MKLSLTIITILVVSSLFIATAQVVDPKDVEEFDSANNSDEEGTDATRELHHIKKQKNVVPAPILPRPMPVQMMPVPMQVQQVQVQEVRHEMSCPEGHDLVDNRCVVNELVPGDFVCAPGSRMIDGQCAQFTRGRRDCPEGFRLSGNRCIATDIIPAELMCEEGELDAAGTSCRIPQDDVVQCPPGYVMGADGLCAQSFPAQKSCPEGHVMHKGGHGCIKEIGLEASPVCSHGSQLDSDGKKCFTVNPKKPKCAKNYKMAKDGSKCMRKTKKILASCPPGFTEFSQHKAVCEKVIEVPPQLTCPQGATLNPLTGQCELETASNVDCPPGFQHCINQPHLCEQIVENVGICPPGTTATGFGSSFHCQVTIDHEIIECCPPGFELSNGKCERIEIFGATTGCQGDCSRVRTFRPQFSCPMEYVLTGSRCIRQISHPCPEAVPIPSECEPFQMYGVSLRSAKAEMEQIPASCLPVIYVEPQICHSEDSISADIVCPDDSEFDNGICILRESLEVEPFCNVGIMDPASGQCIKTSYVPIKTECPAGTTRIGKRCVEYQEHAPEFSCPEGAVTGPTGGCVVRVPALASPGEVIRTAPISVCHSGTLQGGMCYDVERIPRQFVCPAGSVPAGKHAKEPTMIFEGLSDSGKYCVEIADFIVAPPHKKYSKPQYFCPDGTPAKGKHCHSHHKTDAIITCPPGSISRGQLCVHQIAPIPTAGRVRTSIPAPFCPPGTVVQGTRCVSTREAQILMSCPPGYTIQAGQFGERECVRFAPMGTVCPAGTRQSPDGCIRERSVPPTVTAVAIDRCATDICEM